MKGVLCENPPDTQQGSEKLKYDIMHSDEWMGESTLPLHLCIGIGGGRGTVDIISNGDHSSQH